MNDIVKALRTRMPGSPAIGLVIGLSGTGKTQISLKYAYDHDDEYVLLSFSQYTDVDSRRYDHIIFVDASSTESLEKGLVTRIKLIDNQLDITNLEGARNVLADPKGKLTRKWLIIMDNADNSNVKLQDYIPSCDHGSILITSRNSSLSDLNPDGHVEMGVMSREEAVEALLSAALGPKAVDRSEALEGSRMGWLHSSSCTKRDEECAGRIVDELGRLPLAVIQAACYIKKQKCLHQYPNLLKTSRSEILRWPASVQRDKLKYAHSTYAAFDTTLSALSVRALKFLGIISFVNFSDFPKALIELAATLEFNYQPHDLLDRPPEYQSSIDLLREIFCPKGDWNPMELDGLLEELQSYSLVSLVTVSTIITLRFHPLLHGWANDRLSTSDRAVFQSAAIRLLACGTNIDDDYLWPYLSSHMERFSLMTDELHVNDKAAFAAILRPRGQYSGATDVWENIHTIVERVHGERHVRTTRAALKLADAYGRQGDWQRMESMERKIVEIRGETLGDNHLETVYAIASLAGTCSSYGRRYDEAAELELEVIRVRKELCGPQHRLIVEALTGLAHTYEDQGKYHESQALLVEALDMISLLVGRQHPATINVMEQLAHCYTLNGNREGAIILDQEVVELQRSVRGDTHVKTLTAAAELYYKQGQFDAAEKIWRDLIDEGRQAVGGHHGDILQSLDGLAHSVYDLGRYVEAETLWKEVLAGRRATLRDMHVDTSTALFWLARSIYDQERYAEAEVLWREVVAARRATLGDMHVGISRALFWLASSVYDQERYADAEEIYHDLVIRNRTTYGDQHTTTLDSVASLALSITQQSRYAEAEVLWREVVAGRRVTLVDISDDLFWLARSIYDQERYADAEEIYHDLVIRNRTTYGDQHTTTLDSVASLARSINKQLRYAEAEVLWREVVAGRRVTVGDKHLDTLDALDDLAKCIHDQERYAEAEMLSREKVAAMRNSLGEQHEDTLEASFWLARSIFFFLSFLFFSFLWWGGSEGFMP
jgi:tetratricopeptide (TPR) repeat protein